jgi:aerobic-type carbon monoxide dehydrogenase small subunit (CoxS/CutS family)
MMARNRMRGLRALVASVLLASTMGGCDLGEFTTTSTVTLDGREVVTYLVSAWILTPIQNAINAGIDKVFDAIEDGDGDS